jgi:Tfp pilus assembly protein FimT
MTAGRGVRHGSAGVTFIELVVVLAILTTAGALVLPAIGRGTATLRLRSEAGRVAALVREARHRAVSQRHATRVTLDRARSTVALSVVDGDAVREVSLPAGLRLSVDAGGESLTFSSRGMTRETRWIVEGPGGRRLAIEVQGVSGRVTVAPESPS